MTTTPGCIVEYTLNEIDAANINHARKTGTRLATGNEVRAGQSFPMLVVDTEDDLVNGQVFLDGTDTYWATWRDQNEHPDLRADGTWREYPRV